MISLKNNKVKYIIIFLALILIMILGAVNTKAKEISLSDDIKLNTDIINNGGVKYTEKDNEYYIEMDFDKGNYFFFLLNYTNVWLINDTM